MKIIQSFEGSNVSGLTYIRAVPYKNIVYDGQSVTLTDAENYFDIIPEMDTSGALVETVTSKNGDYRKIKVDCFIAGITEENKENIGLIDSGLFVLLCRDGNDRVIMFGSREYPLKCLCKENSGKKLGSSAGFDIDFTGQQVAPSRILAYSFEPAVPTHKVFSKGFNFGFLRT